MPTLCLLVESLAADLGSVGTIWVAELERVAGDVSAVAACPGQEAMLRSILTNARLADIDAGVRCLDE